ncbi:hypothetical protein EYW49_10530 [Siculibacillus lacustris]|uniref:Phytase-like domain-containing protein n=1 Tax=Siculibacillus lacustris TaxID=1549641 RepID=A0A4Q9VR30_9HYPH|nr:esterase-like activity of phytase family protein [Siculibacillus lacustris]TBW38031.1 hypothetical protein EYW49_10530 [Siculibacillus lacustris]
MPVAPIRSGRLGRLAGLLVLAATAAVPAVAAERAVEVGGHRYVVHGLVGVGRIPAATRDGLGETFGSGSGMAMDPAAWHRTATGYAGALWLLPDRGYNVEGTTDYRARFNRIEVTLTPAPDGASGLPQTQVDARITATTLLTDETGEPMTGLDPVGVRAPRAGLPRLPQAVNGRVSLDPEAIVHLADGGFFVSDEYGPFVYRFSSEGKLLSAIEPPAAFLPIRKGKVDFSSNNPGPGAPTPDPKNPERGRQNNQGLEGSALTPDGRFLVSVLQSATRQDGGDDSATRRYTRALIWDVADPAAPKLVHEYVVPLPVFTDAKGKTTVAAQSELAAIGEGRFLLLARDSNNGHGVKGDTSLYRKIEILDFAGATDIRGTYDEVTPVAPKGVLADGVEPATLTPFVDLNDNAELGRFGLHNGKPDDENLLSEKWEAMGLVPTLDPARPDDFFLFVANDNDFITQKGFQVGAAYADAGGAEVDTMFLVWRVTLPGLARR